MSIKTAMIAAAGTGGHIMPGLAIAHQLSLKHYTIEWIGTHHGMENRLVPPHIPLNRLAFKGLRGKGRLGVIKGGYQLLIATVSCLRLMKQKRPSVLIGMGGYICIPSVWAAYCLKIPVVLVNADADVLLSNKHLARYAHTVCCGFKQGSAAQLSNAKVTGNPVRDSIVSVGQSRRQRLDKTLNILVVGGSLGATVLNETVPETINLLINYFNHHNNNHNTHNYTHVKVLHQTGEHGLSTTQALYQRLKINEDTVTTVPFINDMAQAYGWADIIVCRAGAITISELCAAGLPSILVPLLASTTHHQAGNAQYLHEQGAGIHIAQADFTSNTLLNELKALSFERLQAMSNNALTLAIKDSTQSVVSVIEGIY